MNGIKSGKKFIAIVAPAVRFAFTSDNSDGSS